MNMLINSNEINKILAITSSDISNKGKKYFERSKVRPSSFTFKNNENFKSSSFVEGTYLYKVDINKEIIDVYD